MKTPASIAMTLLLYTCIASAQNAPIATLSESAGAYPALYNDAEHPCITPEQYAQIEQQIAYNIEAYHIPQTAQKGQMITALNWPLRLAAGVNDCSFYTISAYVDQNTTAGTYTDWNCGTNSYDGHRGTDIATYPFHFYKMDHDQVEVIAAAPGVIINKVDGNFDKNCATNSLTANYLVVQHADGSTVLYFHMKKNSLTSKSIGQSVALGEYLGVVGSSGNSSGPHLHFEVWNGSTNATRVDPYAGSCNTLNANSWWVAQKPYTEPAVIKASVHTTDIVVPACPSTETTNESTCYVRPFQGAGLPANAAKFYTFYRNETAGMTTTFSILNPDGSVFTSWTANSTTSYNASYRSYTKTLPTNTGTYTFKAVYNGVTCSSTFDVINAVITAPGPTTVCEGSSVALNAGAGGTYLWNTGATTQIINASISGSYTVTVTGANGCSAVSAPFVVTINPGPSAAITPSGATEFCQGGSVMLSAAAGNTYKWSTGATTQSISISNTGTYTATVTSTNGCSAVSTPTTVTVNPLPNAAITPGGATTFCEGGSVMLSAAAGNTYSWSTGATTQSISISNTGTYTATITSANGCSAVSTPTIVTVNPLPSATITPGGSTTFCEGGSVMLSAAAGNTYSWSTGATAQSISVSNSGNYTATITSANGCSAVSTPTLVTVNPLPNAAITPSGPTTFCQGSSVMLSAAAGNTYSWSSGATTQSISISNTGTYATTITNANGCSAVSTPTTVNVNPLPSATITPSGATTFCQGGSVMLSAAAGNTYSWSTGATAQSISISNTGTYTATITSANGCSAVSTPTIVTVNPLPSAAITPSGATTFCQGGSVMLSAAAGNTYSWSSGATTQSISVSNAGTYTATITSANGCSAVSTPTTVTVNPLPSATITPSGPTTFCEGGSVMLSAAAGNTYSWNTGATAQSITVSNSGDYTATVTSTNGCTAVSTSTTVTVNPLPSATINPVGPTTFCQGSTSILVASNGSAYLWSNGATTQSIIISNSGNYTVTITDSNGCSGVSIPIIITVNSLPAPPTISANGAMLSSSYTTGNQWFLNGNILPNAITQTITASQNGLYTVQVTDANDCSSLSSGYNFMSTGVVNATDEQPFILVPNPSTGLFRLETPSGDAASPSGRVEVFNLLGVRVHSFDLQANKNAIDLSGEPAGLYFVVINKQVIKAVKI
jgi:murein DD-endopeptidase MepM/ murein hydrolase activator NlpD